MWDTFYTKVAIERAYIWYVEPMPTSLHYIATHYFLDRMFIIGQMNIQLQASQLFAISLYSLVISVPDPFLRESGYN